MKIFFQVKNGFFIEASITKKINSFQICYFVSEKVLLSNDGFSRFQQGKFDMAMLRIFCSLQKATTITFTNDRGQWIWIL